MKKTLHLFFLSIYIITYSQLNNGLKAFYPFDGDTSDQSGQNHNGQIIGNLNLVEDRFGLINSAYYFPGNMANYVKINYSDDFNISSTGSFSISLWYKGGSIAGGDFEVLFGKENPQVNYKPYDYYLGLYDGNRVLCGGSGYEVLWSPIIPPQPDSNWHHIVFIYENKNWFLYQDNVLTKSNTNQTSIIAQSLNGLVIGRGFQGNIDDVRFYNRKLTENQIDMLYRLNNLSSIENAQVNEMQLYPNPAKDFISVKSTRNENLNYQILDLSGKLIQIGKTNSNEKINVQSLEKGSYILQIQTEAGEKQNVKFLKN